MASFLPFTTMANKLGEALFGHSFTTLEDNHSTEIVILRDDLARYREQHAELSKLFDELAQKDKEVKKVLVSLAQRAEAMETIGINIGIFGLRSTGKSTMVNTLLGMEVAETGVCETTTTIKPYNGIKFILWDVPSRNDEVSYFNMRYISFLKGLSRRLILIQATVEENSSMMKLLDEIGLNYDIVFNKFDKVDEDERNDVQNLIRSEIQQIGLKGVNKIYFVSAKHPNMFNDLLVMVNDLTT